MTNRLALSALDGLDDDAVREVARALVPLSAAVVALFPYPNPIGMPRSWDPESDAEANEIAEVPAG
jgi:hypothetical protein